MLKFLLFTLQIPASFLYCVNGRETQCSCDDFLNPLAKHSAEGRQHCLQTIASLFHVLFQNRKWRK